MKLSALHTIDPSLRVEVIRDGVFESVGLVTYRTPKLLLFLESNRFLPELLANENVACVITTVELVSKLPDRVGAAVAKNPRAAFYRLHNHFAESDFYWKPFATEIASTARVHPRAYVAEKNVRIGPGCVIEPNATILECSVLEENVIVRAGCVVGGEGFQFPVIDGELLPIVHAGGVRLERGVELQQCTCVDRSIFGGFTVVGENTKVDNQVHIAHNCVLGKRNRVAAKAMIAGSVTTGDDVWFGPSCAISSEIAIGSRANITIGAVVTRDVPEGARVTGNFAIDHARFIAHMKSIR